MATGTIVCNAMAKIAKEELGSGLSFLTSFYTETIAKKRKVIETVHASCHQTPACIAHSTRDAAESVKRGESHYRCQIAIKAIECDDISACSNSQKSGAQCDCEIIVLL